ncbi:MAG: hypothetical protein PQJ61_06575 [Spirochaetales bacterium]|uniref:Lipoprotein n=1 Tax=Candidatus Thalassospirochaeta sargassi TaxID=3119039 RepID=A0AAJ1MK36_9SPIO|nr:hypothetical protein [Spirochaetales bacterium]
MKKILIALLVLSTATLAFMGCALIFGTTYSVSTGNGYCYEVTTSEMSTIVAMELLGAVEEPCDTSDVAATCTFISDEYNQEMVNYYSAEYLELYPDVKDNCDGTWETL